MKRILIPLCLVASCHFASGQRSYQFSSNDRLFTEGQEMFNVRNYSGCIDKLEAYKKQAKDADLIQEADFMIVYAANEQGLKHADELLKDFTATYPDSYHKNEVYFLIGSRHFSKGEYEKALHWFDEADIDLLTVNQQEAYTYRKAVALLKTEEIDKARGYFARIEQIGDKYKEASKYYVAYIDYTQGKYNKALIKFKELKGSSEFEKQSSYYIAQISFIQNKYENTIKEGEALIAAYPDDPNNVEMHRIVGDAYYHQGNAAKTIKHLSQYVEDAKNPLRSDLYYLGVCYYESKEYAKAVESFSRSVGQDDALTQNAYLYLGQSYLKLNDKKNARMAFEGAATASYDKQVQEVAMYNYALLIHETAFTGFGESVTIFEDFLNDFPNSKYADKVNDYLVEVYLTTKNYEAALKSINKIKQPSTKIMEAKQGILFQLGTQAFANSQTDKAIELFTDAISLGSYNMESRNDAYFWRGECKYKLGQYDNAIADYRTYLNNTHQRETDMYALAHYNLGYCYFKQKDYDAALSRFRQYTEIESNRSSASYADSYNRIGDCLYQQRQFSEAENNYAHAAQISPSAGDYSVFQKGFLLGLQKDYRGKINEMDKLLSNYPESQYADDALYEKGRSYVLLENSHSAAQAFEKLIRDYPESSLARKAGIQLGLLYFNEGQFDNAAKAYKHVITHYQGSEEARVALQDLKSVYIELNDVAAYADYVNSLGGNIHIDINEQDSLTYIAAEKLFMRGDNNGAQRSLNNYLERYPDGAFSTNANYYLGCISFSKEDYEAALKHFGFVIEKRDMKYMEESVARTAEIQYLNKDFNQAIESFKRLRGVAENPENRQAAQLGIMRCALELKQQDEALKAANALLKDAKLSPEIAIEARYVRAKAYLDQKQPGKAIADLQIVSKDTRTVQGAESKYLLAQLYYNQKEDKKAEAVLDDFAKNGTPHQYWLARGFILYADIYIRQGDMVQARAYLNNLQNNYKENDDIADMIKDRLEKLTK